VVGKGGNFEQRVDRGEKGNKEDRKPGDELHCREGTKP
jgi:hypothetical protein